jgi:hypothetical protein
MTHPGEDEVISPSFGGLVDRTGVLYFAELATRTGDLVNLKFAAVPV